MIWGWFLQLAVHNLFMYSGLIQHYPFSGGCIPWAMQEGTYRNDTILDKLSWVLRGSVGNALMIARIFIFIRLCLPRSSYPWSELGDYTLYPYLLHQVWPCPFTQVDDPHLPTELLLWLWTYCFGMVRRGCLLHRSMYPALFGASPLVVPTYPVSFQLSDLALDSESRFWIDVCM